MYPPHLAMEQCSSQFTAEYKAQVAAQLVEEESEPTLVDLTGGFGVDFSAMVRGFAHGTYVERRRGCARSRGIICANLVSAVALTWCAETAWITLRRCRRRR